jgi:hypothetical protein
MFVLIDQFVDRTYARAKLVLRRWLRRPRFYGAPSVAASADSPCGGGQAAIGAQVDILLEPVRRESGPAIVAGAAYAVRRGDDPLIVALAADHVVSLAFAKECAIAAQNGAGRQDRLVRR